MGLFSKKDPCPICGGAVKGLLPTKVEGQAICKECSKDIDLPDGVLNRMTLMDFREYLTFRQQNDILRRQFKPTQEVSFGFFTDRYSFDVPNRLMCRNDSSWVTIFEGSDVKSFVVREDNDVLFEGTPAGLKCYTSSVPQRINDMAPLITRARWHEEMNRNARLNDRTEPYSNVDIPRPFDRFYIEIYLNHPYWDMLTTDFGGPTFDSTPTATEYLREYTEAVNNLTQFARGLMQVAFPGAPEERVGMGVPGQAAAAAANVDAVAEIQRFKALVDQGILTEEEFAAKKRQLLGL